ncbi:hypothetical protein [Flavobacterium algoritolerans]|uniref:Gp5/Type VI secretion system Vgr protein OB-fold domain-containing protein n=1 Tax=Flavobacterium algoritolerans TaxID=3041254 RepID=A0ABT6V930_9FLAO|nr:hypothetical protein [Flavobacterium algoritolerans]MDI5894401.1 hypothetical protein [Flavobacterium algoritolerans]
MILEAIERIIEGKLPMTVARAKVIKLNATSCQVRTLTKITDYFQCSYNSIIDNDGQELKIEPEVGSVVVIAIFDSAATIIQTSKVKSFSFKYGETVFKIDDSGTQIERQNENLKSVINDLQDEIGKLCDALNATIVLPGYGTTPNIPNITNIKNKVLQTKTRINKILK